MCWYLEGEAVAFVIFLREDVKLVGKCKRQYSVLDEVVKPWGSNLPGIYPSSAASFLEKDAFLFACLQIAIAEPFI